MRLGYLNGGRSVVYAAHDRAPAHLTAQMARSLHNNGGGIYDERYEQFNDSRALLSTDEESHPAEHSAGNEPPITV